MRNVCEAHEPSNTKVWKPNNPSLVSSDPKQCIYTNCKFRSQWSFSWIIQIRHKGDNFGTCSTGIKPFPSKEIRLQKVTSNGIWIGKFGTSVKNLPGGPLSQVGKIFKLTLLKSPIEILYLDDLSGIIVLWLCKNLWILSHTVLGY